MHTSELDRLTRLFLERSSALGLYLRQWARMDMADDIVQDVFVALLTESVAPRDPVRWMFRAARNAAIDYARSAARRNRREHAVADTQDAWFEPQLQSVLDTQAAEQALQQLAAEDREIVVLRIWGDCDFRQIAEIVGLSPSTVHERYRLALAAMRSALEKPCPKNTH